MPCRHGCGDLHQQIQFMQEHFDHLHREQDGIWAENLTVSFWPWNILCWTLLQDGGGPFAPHNQHIRHLGIMLIWDVGTELFFFNRNWEHLCQGRTGRASRAQNQQGTPGPPVCCYIPANITFLVKAEPVVILPSVAQKRLLPSSWPPLSLLPVSLSPFWLDSPGLLFWKLPSPEVKLDRFKMHSQDSSLGYLNHVEAHGPNTLHHGSSSRPELAQIKRQLSTAENFSDGGLLRRHWCHNQTLKELLKLCFSYQISLLPLLMIIIIRPICILLYRLQSMLICLYNLIITICLWAGSYESYSTQDAETEAGKGSSDLSKAERLVSSKAGLDFRFLCLRQ